MPVVSEINVSDYRQAERAIEPLFVKRWSPRAMSGEPISEQELMTLFEAARWSPSSYNEQPWRFLYARREGPHWQTFFDLLVEFNQSWTHSAAVLVVVLSRSHFTHNRQPNPVHSFDAGAAWQGLALQGAAMGLVTHGMAGFDAERAREALQVPDDYDVEAMIAIGRPGRSEDLPKELQAQEVPNGRRPVAETVCEGPFKL
jgi:nitroreductase